MPRLDAWASPRERADAIEAARYAMGRIPNSPAVGYLRTAVNGSDECLLEAIHHVIQWERRPPVSDG